MREWSDRELASRKLAQSKDASEARRKMIGEAHTQTHSSPELSRTGKLPDAGGHSDTKSEPCKFLPRLHEFGCLVRGFCALETK